MYSEVHGQEMISDTSLFLIATDDSTNINLRMHKVTFSKTVVDWASKINCPSQNCLLNQSKVSVSSDFSKLYNLINYGVSGSQFGLLITLNILNGQVIGNRYSSSSIWGTFFGGVLMGNYFIVIGSWSPNVIINYNIVTDSFTNIQIPSSLSMYCILEEPIYTR